MEVRVAGNGALQELISPLSAATFFAEYFERDVLHVARNDRAYFSALYGVGCVEDSLAAGAHEPERFALIKHGAGALPVADYTSERRPIRRRGARAGARAVVDVRAVLAAFANGYTLTVKDAAALHVPLERLCGRIQAECGIFVGVNAYFTPPRAQGFGPHYDTHDTLITQIEGDKLWRVAAPVLPLPLETQPFVPADQPAAARPARAIALGAGDSLYIPRGYLHEAQTSHARSLHLTFTLSPVRMIDVLDALVALAGREDVDLRRALPWDWRTDPDFAQRISTQLAKAVARAIAPDRIAPAAERVADEMFAATRVTCTGAFDSLAALESIRPASRIVLRDDTPFELRPRGEWLEVVLATKRVRVPLAALRAFTRLAAGPATFAEIEAALSDGSARRFLSVAVAEALVQIEA